MNRFSLTPTLVLTLLILAPAAGAQGQDGKALPYQTGNPADWPSELDAVSAAPANHRVLMENDRVRVLEVTMAPREVEDLHHHQWPSVLYITEIGHFIDRNADGEVILDTREMDGPLPLPLTMWKDPEAPHSVENLSDHGVRLIRVELKTSDIDTAADRAAIRAISDAWEAAARAGDPDAVTALYTDAAVVQPGGEPAVRGREALGAYFVSGFSEPFDITLSTEEVVFSDDGDFAYETGSSFDGWGKYLVVYRRTPDGWRIAADSWSGDAPAAATN